MQHFLYRLFEPKSNGFEMTLLLAEILDVKISGSALNKKLEEHPHYPSLLSVSDVLKGYGIENLGVKVEPDKLIELKTPFITQFKYHNEQLFTVVKEISQSSVVFFDPEKHRWKVLSTEDFSKRCSKIALLVEVAEDAGEKDYLKNKQLERQKLIAEYLKVCCIPVLAISTGIIAFIQHGMSALLPFTISMFTLIGCLISILLLWYELDQHNPLLMQICNAGKKVNCGAVLQSKASSIAGISWSTIGFSYFMGSLILLLFSGITNGTALFIISWLVILAMPYPLFSIYYQRHIVKQWCVLCLIIQALLILQLIVVIGGGWYTHMPKNLNITQILISFTIPFLTIMVLLPALKKAKQGKLINSKLQKLKYNSQVFDALINNQKQLIESPDGLGIILGNPLATYKVIKVCNPYCRPCSAAHQPIEELLHNNTDVQVQIIFPATNEERDLMRPPVKHLLAIAEKYNKDILKQALDDWYLAKDKDYEDFAAKYPLNEELNKQDDKIAAMHNWCQKSQVSLHQPSLYQCRIIVVHQAFFSYQRYILSQILNICFLYNQTGIFYKRKSYGTFKIYKKIKVYRLYDKKKSHRRP